MVLNDLHVIFNASISFSLIFDGYVRIFIDFLIHFDIGTTLIEYLG